jgi:hypothetical protein
MFSQEIGNEDVGLVPVEILAAGRLGLVREQVATPSALLGAIDGRSAGGPKSFINWLTGSSACR